MTRLVQRMVSWLELPYVGENGYKDQEAVVALAGAKRNVARDGGVSLYLKNTRRRSTTFSGR